MEIAVQSSQRILNAIGSVSSFVDVHWPVDDRIVSNPVVYGLTGKNTPTYGERRRCANHRVLTHDCQIVPSLVGVQWTDNCIIVSPISGCVWFNPERTPKDRDERVDEVYLI